MAAYQRLVMWLKVLFSVFTLASLLLSEEHLLLALFCKPLTCRLPSTRRDCGRGKSKGRGLPGGMAAYLATCLSEHMAVLRSKKLPRGACKGLGQMSLQKDLKSTSGKHQTTGMQHAQCSSFSSSSLVWSQCYREVLVTRNKNKDL